MNITELSNVELNRTVAYIVGLTYPLIKIINTEDGRYIVGGINHNSNMVNEGELAAHYEKLSRMISEDLNEFEVLLMANNNERFRISSKRGFSVLIETGGLTDAQCREQLDQIVDDISQANNEIKKYFAMGCFDGRGSWDTTYHMLAIDVDRDHEKQQKIVDIIGTIGVSVNKNQREVNHKKSDQLRIRRVSVENFMENIGLLSNCRIRLINRVEN